MEGFRRHLRAWSMAWLLCQAAFLSAFVPRDCCAAHRAHAHETPECHEVAQKPHCPMPSGDAAACPMHQKESDRTDCRMRGTCDGPLAQLAHLFSYSSLPASSLVIALPPPPSGAVGTVVENALQQARPPDAPPPRL